MSDHYTTQHNHKKRIISEVRDLFYWCKQGRWNFHKFLEQRSERVMQHNSYKRLTRYNQQYVNGYMDRMYEEMDREMEWRVFVPELGHVNARSAEGRKQMEGNWSKCISDLGASFWPGTNRVWSSGNTTHDVIAMYREDGSRHETQFDIITAEYVEKDRERRAKLHAEAPEKYAYTDNNLTTHIEKSSD